MATVNDWEQKLEAGDKKKTPAVSTAHPNEA